MKKINNEENLSLATAEVEAVEVKQEKTIEQIAEDIKKEQGLKEVFITDIADQKVIWRKLKRSEYKEIMTREYSENEDLAYFEKQDFVASKVILYPENIEDKLAKKVDLTTVDALKYATEAGNIKAVNVVLIGVMAKNTDIAYEKWVETIKTSTPAKFLDSNLKAFELGYNLK